MPRADYPWFSVVEGDDLEQGDIFENCPVFVPPDDLSPTADTAEFDCQTQNVILLSQSCDLAKGREKLTHVLLCPLWESSDMTKGLTTKQCKKKLEDLRKGRKPALQLLNRCHESDFEREFRIVDFRDVYSLPLGFVRSFAANAGKRLRLLPPYREHMAQSFSRYFMRVGLPVDIPAFK